MKKFVGNNRKNKQKEWPPKDKMIKSDDKKEKIKVVKKGGK